MHEHINTALQPAEGAYDPEAIARNYLTAIPVTIGAYYLDHAYPGWEMCIDLNRLDMDSGDDSVLAMVVGTSIREVAEWRDWSSDALVAHGFLHPRKSYRTCEGLTAAWRKLIISRLERTQK